MTLYELIKNHQHRVRLKEIIHVFYEQGFGFLISKVQLGHHLPLTKRIKARIMREKDITLPVRLRKAFEQLGPTFIKFGQLLSLRPDVLPPEYITEFEKMQDHVPAFPFEQAQKIIEQELRKPIKEVFTVFNPKPIASASISQVYKAKLKNKVVAVKVQRPGIKETVKTDIELMYKLAELLERHVPELRNYHLRAIVHEFERWTIKELNFRIEAYYAQKLAEDSRNLPMLKIPAMYPELTTEKVLVMEFIKGTPLHEIKELKRLHINLRKVFQDGYDIFLRHFFVNGLFHADPHPGNLLILKGGRIALIDFGIVGQFDKKLKENTLDLLRTIVNRDYETATTVLLRMSSDGTINRSSLETEVREVFEQLQYTSIKDIQVSQGLRDLVSLINKHHVQVPVEFVLFVKTIVTIEGLALKYQPDFNFMSETKASLHKFLDHAYMVKNILHKTKTKISEYKELAEVFPETALELLQKAKQFKVNIEIEDREIRDLTVEIERSSGNLALGLILAALIVASALIMQTAASTYVYISGFILAGILGLWLVHRTIFVNILKR